MSTRRSKRAAVWFCAVGIGLAACSGGGGGKGKAGAKGSSSARAGRGSLTYPVDVYAIESKKLAYTVTAPGTLEAFEQVQVTARVAGIIDKVAFTEGQKVEKGAPLVVIDSERYQLAVQSAAASYAKADASRKEKDAQTKRREAAMADHPGLIPTEELATYQTQGLTAKADVDLAGANLRIAEVNLRDSSVKAPMAGVIQTRTVETGQYVQVGTVLATLLQNDPMLLRFDVVPLEAPRLKTGMTATFKLRETLRTFQAKITLVAGAADPDSHMVKVTAEVIQEDHKYWLRPGSFCDVTVDVDGARNVVAVPRTAVRPSEHGFLAYVVEDGVAHERTLSLGMNTRDGWVEVRDGLKPGDKLVIRGAEPLSDGAKVTAKDGVPTASTGFADSSATPVDSPPPAPAAPSSSASAGAPGQ